jgi:hypothetical protein
LEALGYAWPFAEFSLLILFAFNIAGGLAVTQVYKIRPA